MSDLCLGGVKVESSFWCLIVSIEQSTSWEADGMLS